jgi:flagellar motility protein MotE (MotC chaperone)
MKKLLTSVWLIPVVGTLLYLGTTFLLLNPSALKIPRIQVAARQELPGDAENPLVSTPWDFRAPDIDRLVAELKEEKERLDKRQSELDEYAARIAVERSELNSVTQEVSKLQRDFNQVVTYVTQQEADVLKRQSRVFAAMAPEDAGRVLAEMPDDRIVRLLMFMSEEEMARILGVLAKPGPENAKRAAQLTEKLRLSVQAPPEGKKQSSVKPGKAVEPTPAKQLAAVLGTTKAGRKADLHKLARGYAAMPTTEAVRVLKELQDDQMAAVLAEFTEEETAPFLTELAKTGPAGPQRVAHIQELLLQKLKAGNS